MAFEHTVGGGHVYCISLQANIDIQKPPGLPAVLKETSIFASIQKAIVTVIFTIIFLLFFRHYIIRA